MKMSNFHKKDQARRDMRMAEIKMSMGEYKEAKIYLNAAVKSLNEMEKENAIKTSKINTADRKGKAEDIEPASGRNEL